MPSNQHIAQLKPFFPATAVHTCTLLLGILEKNTHRFLYVNPTGASMLGYENAEALQHENIERFFVDASTVPLPRQAYKQSNISLKPQGICCKMKDRFVQPFDAVVYTEEVMLKGEQFYFIQIEKKLLTDIHENHTYLDAAKLNGADAHTKSQHRICQNQNTASFGKANAEALQRMPEKERELSELKSRFVTMASHEFRTPLSTILSSLYLIEKYTTTEEQPKRKRHIDRIAACVHALTEILNDFLSVGKLEEGHYKVEMSTFSLPDVIQQVMQNLEPTLKKGQRFHSIHRGINTARLDVNLLKHIVTNLLVNAIKFSGENKPIRLYSSIKNNTATIRVSDRGIGIPYEDQPHLFERFFRARNAVNIQGTGLGLHIVARYTSLMHGDISFCSESDKGTRFTLKFPMNTLITEA